MPEPVTTLAAIEQKVRRLTRSPSLAQLSKPDLDNYINTFVIYDFPEQLRTFNLHKQFTFICTPFQDTYKTDDTLPIGNVLKDFQNKYLTINPPVYIAGYNAFYTQSRENFFGIYPFLNSIATIGTTGNGVTVQFQGVINTNQAQPGNVQQLLTLLQGQVLFSSIASNGAGLAMVDVPVIDPASGLNRIFGNLYEEGLQPLIPPITILADNNINYVTGEFIVTFPLAPADGATINSQTCPQAISIPQGMLFYENQFTLRPVPDQPYRINFEVYARPTTLLADNQSPELNEWWQYIAYGAAKKIFEDRMDTDSVQQIMPEFEMQRLLCNRRTIVQNSNMRTSTIYQENTGSTYNGGWGWGNGPF